VRQTGIATVITTIMTPMLTSNAAIA